MSAAEVKNAQTNLTCPVCYRLFKNPKYLPCYHSYCQGCLEKIQVQSKITCPECRKVAKVPAGGVKEFTNNFFISRLVDDLIVKKKVAEEAEKVKCDSCTEDDPVVSFCPECNAFLCNLCNEFHKRSKQFSRHDVVPLTELQSDQGVPIQAKPKVPLCQEHDYELKHYCETCSELVCMYCTMKTHNEHNHDTVKSVASKHRNHLKEITAPMEEMIKDLSGSEDKIDKMMKKIKQQGEEVNMEIDKHYNELAQKLMKQSSQVKQQVDDMVSQKEKALKKQLDDLRSTKDGLVKLKELNDALEKSSDEEILSAEMSVIDGMQQLNNSYEKINKVPVQSVTVEFVPTEESFPQFGRLSVLHSSVWPDLPEFIALGEQVNITIITKGTDDDKKLEQTPVKLKSYTNNIVVGPVVDNKDGTYMASFTGEKVGEAKLSVLINGQETRGSPYSIVVCRNYQAVNLSDKILNKSGSMGKPWGIAFGKHGVWAVADESNHCVHIFDGQDQLVVSVGSKGKSNGEFNYPHGVAFDDDDHFYVADFGNHRIQKFDVNGNYLLQFGSSGSGNGQLQSPFGIIAHNGRVYVAEYANHRISVFEYNGHFCITFGADRLGAPWDLAINTNNQLLIADHTHSSVVVFTLFGQYKGRFGTPESGKGQLKCPCSLATDVNGFVLVGDNHSSYDCITVFGKDGNFIHCFGSHGSSSGQLNSPLGIAVSPNGSIYVCDCNNKRIQIFSNF